MKFIERIKDFFAKYLFNAKWRCVVCGREIFNDKYFCEKCEKELPINSGAICDHCGRKLKVAREYCTTCKGNLVNVDKCRSVYVYDKQIKLLIQKMKYGNARYLVDLFAEQMSLLYLKNYMNAQAVVYIPMTKKAFDKRGYNQSQLLAQSFAKIVNLPVLDCMIKTKETIRQAKLGRTDRRKNLIDCFRVVDKKAVKDKKVVIIDDVTTTGSTAEVVAEKLKKAGATKVFLMSVASVPPKCQY